MYCSIVQKPFYPVNPLLDWHVFKKFSVKSKGEKESKKTKSKNYLV